MLFGPGLFTACYLMSAAPDEAVTPDVITKQHEVYATLFLSLLLSVY